MIGARVAHATFRYGHAGNRARRYARLACVLAVTAVLAPALASCSAHADPGVNRTGYITLPDGVKVAYDLTRPATPGRFPVALEYNHYSAGADNGAEIPGTDAGDLLAAGFAVLGVNEAGSGCSGGIDDMADLDEWGRAGAEVVEWAAAQPWSTGHVGMFGSSWTGITQVGIASFRPRGLDAIAPFHIAADFYRDVAYPGGISNAAFTNYYSRYVVQADAQAARGAFRPVTRCAGTTSGCASPRTGGTHWPVTRSCTRPTTRTGRTRPRTQWARSTCRCSAASPGRTASCRPAPPSCNTTGSGGRKAGSSE